MCSGFLSGHAHGGAGLYQSGHQRVSLCPLVGNSAARSGGLGHKSVCVDVVPNSKHQEKSRRSLRRLVVSPCLVMPGLVPASTTFAQSVRKTWMAGSSPAMTTNDV